MAMEIRHWSLWIKLNSKTSILSIWLIHFSKRPHKSLMISQTTIFWCKLWKLTHIVRSHWISTQTTPKVSSFRIIKVVSKSTKILILKRSKIVKLIRFKRSMTTLTYLWALSMVIKHHRFLNLSLKCKRWTGLTRTSILMMRQGSALVLMISWKSRHS